MKVKNIFKGLVPFLLASLLGATFVVNGCASKKPTPAPKNQQQNQGTQPPQGKTARIPKIPHTLAGRQNCLSCHKEGINGAPKTPHPNRPNCTKCHKPA